MPKVPKPAKQVAGKISFKWAKTQHDNPDWFATWMHPADRGTCNLILTELPKLAEELVKRGYTRESIKFECSKPTPHE